MTHEVHSDWFGKVNMDVTDPSRAAFSHVDQLLSSLQPAAIQRDRSTATVTAAGIQIVITHATDPRMTIDLHYNADSGGMIHPGGSEEYYRLRDEPPVERDALDDLTTVLTSTYLIEETWWRGRHIRTVVAVKNAEGEDKATSTSGWLLPPRWIIPRNRLTTQSRTASFGCRRTGESTEG